MKSPAHGKILAWCAVAFLTFGGQPALAQNSEFSSAVQTFNAAQYPQAADMFVQYLRQQPNDALAHYYLGVTWHCLGRAQEAANEYGWVQRNSQDPELLKRVNMGLTVVSRALAAPPQAPVQQAYAPAPQYAPQGQQFAPQYPQQAYQPVAQTEYGAVTGGGGGGTTGWLSSRGAQQAAAATGSTLPANIGTQGRIIDLYTQWCGWCKKFEPIFMQAQAKYGSAIQFERLDAEAAGSDRIVKKYRVKGYPTVLLLDNQGRLRKRIDGAPSSLQDFESTIFAAYPAVRSY